MAHATTSATISVGNFLIRQHNGLYSLNDLHRASGGCAKHQPALFIRLDTTKALIAEIGNSTDMQSFISKGGRNGGTYACRELVIWISPAFHLKVIRVFLDATAPAQQALPMPEACAPGISPAVVNEIVASTTQHIVETLRQKQVTAALNDSNTAITFPELTKLANAALERLQRAVKAEAYTAISSRARRQGVPTTKVSLHA